MLNRLAVSRLLVAGLAVSMVGWTGPATAASDGSTGHDRAAEARATSALTRAEHLFTGDRSLREKQAAGGSTDGRDATLVLRDLARTADALPTSAQRRRAAQILARPTDGDAASAAGDPEYTSPAGSDCGAHICVHWVEDGTRDSVHGGRVATGNDGDLSTVPTYVKTTLSTMEHVYYEEVTKLGYRKPLSDGTLGGNSKTDVYLADVGSEGYYGYCTSDASSASTASQIDAYCVLDNDYARSQFPYHTATENLHVTAAHEFFHAVQFAYDADEDDWFMEGTAAWMEDEVYDGVDDNRQYLAASMLSDPYVPLDTGSGDFEYGAWIFWRYLSESARAGAADDPTVIRNVWHAAIGKPYSTLALRRVLAARGGGFAKSFTNFGTAIRNPARYLSEGRHYRAAPLERSATLTTRRRSSPAWSIPVDHMSHSFIRFTPGSSLTGRWRIRVSLNLPGTSRGSLAQMVAHRKDGTLGVRHIHLSADGNATHTFTFSRSAVHYLELDLINDSVRFKCWQGRRLSCQGAPLDENLTAHVSARALR